MFSASNSPVSADELYEECAGQVLAQGVTGVQSMDNARILIEAATVAKVRAPTDPQLRRAIKYLDAIEPYPFFPLRVLGTLTELHALRGDIPSYEKYRDRVAKYRREHNDLQDSHVEALDGALERAKRAIERVARKRK